MFCLSDHHEIFQQSRYMKRSKSPKFGHVHWRSSEFKKFSDMTSQLDDVIFTSEISELQTVHIFFTCLRGLPVSLLGKMYWVDRDLQNHIYYVVYLWRHRRLATWSNDMVSNCFNSKRLTLPPVKYQLHITSKITNF